MITVSVIPVVSYYNYVASTSFVWVKPFKHGELSYHSFVSDYSQVLVQNTLNISDAYFNYVFHFL